jgi:rhodanese-related sulfurtransferase
MLLSLPELISRHTAEVRCVDIHTAAKEIAANGGLLIDIREPAEVSAKAAPNTHNIPRGILEVKAPELASDPDTPIYLHCAGGGRARLAVEQLTRMGYRNVTAISCTIDNICAALGEAG